MSIEQWGVLGLIVLLPLLGNALRLRQARAGNGVARAQAGEVRTLRRGVSRPHRATDAALLAATQIASSPPPLPPSVPTPALSPATLASRLAASRTWHEDSASTHVHRTNGKSAATDSLGQWLRSDRNRRRAIIMVAILGPRTQ